MSDCCVSTPAATDCCSGEPDGNGLHVAIIGSGSAAFAAAIKAADAGARVSLIEAQADIGGTCVNVGCVPSKVMIRTALLARHQAQPPFAGLAALQPVIDRAAQVEQQQATVAALRAAKYEDILAARSEITLIRGRARFDSAQVLVVDRDDGEPVSLQPDRILIASGASAAVPDIPGLDETPYWTSTEALVATAVPRHLIVIGASVVAVELAQAFLHLGASVTLLARSTMLSQIDPALGDGLMHALQGEGMVVRPHSAPQRVAWQDGSFEVSVGDEQLGGDALLVATGRTPNTAALQLARAGIDTDSRGAIPVSDRLQTCVPHIYGAGDCTDKPQYVYVAAASGTRAATNMLGGEARLDLEVMPAVVFTEPAVATVGMTVAQAQAAGIDADSRRLDLDNVPRALANFDTRGFIQLVADAGTGRLLGAQILASEAGEVVQSAALAIRQRMTVDDLAGQLFPYLTMVEGLKLCAQTFSRDVSQLSCCAG